MLRRNDGVSQWLPDRFLAGPSEHVLGMAVPLVDHPVLEHVHRRFPHRLCALRRREAEELPVHPLGLLEEIAGLRPHPVGRITR